MQEREQIAKLRKHLQEEVEFHKDQIDEHKVPFLVFRFILTVFCTAAVSCGHDAFSKSLFPA